MYVALYLSAYLSIPRPPSHPTYASLTLYFSLKVPVLKTVASQHLVPRVFTEVVYDTVYRARTLYQTSTQYITTTEYLTRVSTCPHRQGYCVFNQCAFLIVCFDI